MSALNLSSSPAKPPRLLQQVRECLRTEESYVNWIKRFILFHGKRQPAEIGAFDKQKQLDSRFRGNDELKLL